MRVEADSLGQIEQLDDVDPALAGFNAGDE
jgi:hypothetical protein